MDSQPDPSIFFGGKLVIKGVALSKELDKFFKYFCEQCESRPQFREFTALKTHCQEHHTEFRITAICCDKTFKSRNDMAEHLHWHLEPDDFKCKICNKTYNTAVFLRRHVKNKHKDPKKYLCEDCNTFFMTKAELKVHKKVQHDLSRKFVCEKCGNRYPSSTVLKVHLQIHDPEGKVPCPECGILLIRASLNTHIKRHAVDKLLKCPDCEYTTKKPESLRTHRIRVHSKIYHCDPCKLTFNAANLARKHWLSHIKKNCDVCDRQFISKDRLRTHMQRIHNLVVPSNEIDIYETRIEDRKLVEEPKVVPKKISTLTHDKRNAKTIADSHFDEPPINYDSSDDDNNMDTEEKSHVDPEISEQDNNIETEPKPGVDLSTMKPEKSISVAVDEKVNSSNAVAGANPKISVDDNDIAPKGKSEAEIIPHTSKLSSDNEEHDISDVDSDLHNPNESFLSSDDEANIMLAPTEQHEDPLNINPLDINPLDMTPEVLPSISIVKFAKEPENFINADSESASADNVDNDSTNEEATEISLKEKRRLYREIKKRPHTFRCQICDRGFYNELLYTRHVRAHSRAFICDFCSKPFKDSRHLYRHHKFMHFHEWEEKKAKDLGIPYIRKEPPLKPKYNRPCPHCDGTFHDLAKHIKKKHLSLTHICSSCKSVFPTQKRRREHLCKTTKCYTCDVCKKTFKKLPTMRNHEEKAHPQEVSDQKERDRVEYVTLYGKKYATERSLC